MFWICEDFGNGSCGQTVGPFRTELNAEDYCKYASERGSSFRVLSREELKTKADLLEQMLQVYFEEHVEW